MLNVELENQSLEPGDILIGFRGSKQLDERVKRAAAHMNISVSEFVRCVLCDYIRRFEMQYDPQDLHLEGAEEEELEGSQPSEA